MRRSGGIGRGEQWGIVLLLFALAFGLRLVGLDYGYFHGDERINDAAKVLAGQLVPGQHFYPPLLNYLNGLAFGVLYGLGRVVHWWPDSAGFRAQYFDDPTVFYLTARGVTAVLGAVVAPLGYVFAQRLGFGRGRAVIAGLFAALMPLGLFMSHLAKGDAPLASATMLVALLFLVKVQAPHQRGPDLWLGVAVVLALSFKHSIIFFLVPLLLAHIIMLRGLGLAGYGAALGRTVAVVALLWPLLNIGILLDLDNFIAFQRIQAVMSVQVGDSLWDGVVMFVRRASDLQWGVNIVMLLGFAAMPVWLWSGRAGLPDRGALWALWLVTVLALGITVFLVRTRQPEHLWVAYFAVMHLLAVVTLLDMTRCAGAALARGAMVALGLSAGLAVYALGVLWGQALAVPVSQDIAAIVAREYGGRKVMSGVEVDLPQTMAAQAVEFARIDRLAAKYAVEMPERAGERRIVKDAPDAVFHIPMPGVMFGLESATDAELKGKVKPYAWPLQPEEWVLDYWLAQGIDVIIVSNLPYLTEETPSQILRAFYADVAARCEPAHVITPRKPLFLEREVIIFECKGAL